MLPTGVKCFDIRDQSPLSKKPAPLSTSRRPLSFAWRGLISAPPCHEVEPWHGKIKDFFLPQTHQHVTDRTCPPTLPAPNPLLSFANTQSAEAQHLEADGMYFGLTADRNHLEMEQQKAKKTLGSLTCWEGVILTSKKQNGAHQQLLSSLYRHKGKSKFSSCVSGTQHVGTSHKTPEETFWRKKNLTLGFEY